MFVLCLGATIRTSCRFQAVQFRGLLREAKRGQLDGVK